MMVGATMYCGVALAQTQVRGTVVSAEDGEPIVGASVMVALRRCWLATARKHHKKEQIAGS